MQIWIRRFAATALAVAAGWAQGPAGLAQSARSEAGGDEPTGSVVGTVTERAGGGALIGARVRLAPAGLEAVTDVEGWFAIDGVPAGRHRVDVRLGSEAIEGVAEVDVRAGRASRVQVTLAPSRRRWLERVVVTPKRGPTSLFGSMEAVSLIDRARLDAAAGDDVASVLESLPGLYGYDVGGAGADPSFNVRGFTGGGETDYMLVLVDGVRVNDPHTGRVDWRHVPLDQVERIEVVRGPVSALYGDAAVGGVVQVFTRRPTDDAWGGRIESGSFGRRGVSAHWSGAGEGRWISARARGLTADGWRERSERDEVHLTLRAGGEGERHRWTSALRVHDNDYAVPGPLPRPLYLQDPTRSIRPFDRRARQRVLASWEGSWRRPTWLLEATLSGDYGDETNVETVLFSTQQRELERLRGRAEARALRSFGDAGQHRLLLGMSAAGTRFTSRYFAVDAHAAPGACLADGTGHRLAFGGYAQVDWQLSERWDALAGLRGDVVSDAFDEEISEGAFDDADHSAMVPRLGVVFRPAGRTAVFANASGTFRVPTGVQLYDQRRLMGIMTSNPRLDPQRGVGVELGVRQALGAWGHVEGSVYRTDLEDEITFDPARLRLANIGESRHEGAELVFSARFGPRWYGRASASFVDATFEAGAEAGRQIDNVPRRMAAVELGWRGGRWSASASARFVRETFLDPMNAARLGDYEAVGLSAGCRIGAYRLGLRVSNLLDERYASWGYLSPVDQSAFVYPGQDRSIAVSVSRNWSTRP